MVGYAGGPGNWWSCGSGWRLGFIAFFVYCLRVEISLRCGQTFPGKEKCLLGQLLPFGTSCSLFFKFPLSVVALTAVRDRDKEVYSVTASC
jgi:hypothetical protein